ncbi:MAG: asparagine synthase (glutamine-hydrolyzing), partial [Rhodospirillales bacterium]
YALAVYDAARRQLIVSRDPLGIKPLYYTETSSGFCFASEPQALIKAGLVQPNVCEKSIHELLQLQFSCGPQTAFENIHRVLPGETLVVENGRIVGRHKINALPEERPRDQSLDEALHRLDEVFAESVELHQRADVPYGMFLSGGVDSSAVLAMMKRLNAEPVHAFTAGFADSTVHDERAQARRIAKVVGAKHTEVEFTESDFWTLLPRAAAAMDDPAADYAVLPSYKLAQAAKEAGLKVILTGEGGDELFAGYGRYRRARRLKLFGGRPMRHRGILEGLGVLRQETDSFHWRDGIAAVEHDAGTAGLTALQAAQATDCADWLPHDLLTKLDRCLMAFGVEGRVPFLDQRMAEFAFTLADHLKVRRGMGKWLLRTWLDRHLPEAAPFARKRGFTVPVGAWIATRAAEIGPLVAKQPGVEELCDPKAVVNLFNSVASNQNGQSAKAAWTLVFYALWHQTHILNKAPAKSVQESLA